MAITQRAALQLFPTPDGKGLRYYGLQSVTGDASGGAIVLLFTLNPWRDMWITVDHFLVYTANAATDQCNVGPASNAFTDPNAWGTVFDGNLINKTVTNGFIYTVPNFVPFYLGRYANGAANDMFQIGINPNTNTKAVTGVIAGRIMFAEPGLDFNG